MAYITGEAANHRAMLGILRDYLTADPGLVAAGQNWTQVGASYTPEAGGFVSLRGPGASGVDQIFLTLQSQTTEVTGLYNIRMRGHTAYSEQSPSTDPPGNNSGWVYTLLSNTPIRYWIIANGRRFILITAVNARYDVLYGGFILPEHLPSDWSYPLLIGGSASDHLSNSNTTISHRNFWDTRDTAFLFTPAQSWRTFDNYTGSGAVNTATTNVMYSIDWNPNFRYNFTRTLDGQPWISPGRITELGGLVQNTLGVYDGVFFVSNVGLVAESIITVSGVDYLVVPNVFRTTNYDLAAIRLE